ncbi:MAG: carbohydrate porin [Sphingomonas sp.]|uniref:carbohydrate porin n=1 Tax=Sphingomonas sp. TaxID=28214 RepID=UPI001AD23006|nr:carbohydrate porin [Sphingomonas sp.]MBN8808268.1 carbohydrate porin [Sphingomonas sp.]
MAEKPRSTSLPDVAATQSCARRLLRFRLHMLAGAAAIAAITIATPAAADDPPPVLSVLVRNILDGWAVLDGDRRQPVVLDRLQVSGTVAFDRLGIEGLSLHGQIFRIAGSSLSERIGDVQTADAIDAVPTMRLFEAWAEKRWGSADRSIALRVGLMDLNADFDSISAAGSFINSSHGVGADLARSGLNGPSIYPVSAFGARLDVAPWKRFAIRYALLDGVAGDPARPRAFVIARLAPRDGSLSIAQMDWRPNEKVHFAAGAWRYSRSTVTLDGAERGYRQGVYAEAEGSLTKKISVWGRIGVDDGRVEVVSGYVGAGLLLKGAWAGRPDDSVGIAVARAYNSPQARRPSDLAPAETSVELTYQFKLSPVLSAQPDFQYIFDPSLDHRARNAAVLGLRLIASFGFPKPSPPTDPGDPTVKPPDPVPPDDSATPSG